ncbi:MAG: hypothetical protein MZV64_24285 [Ignavibacteriales bacterium]|nr:hypothetical protein [Ignavibacteriales bacterium]
MRYDGMMAGVVFGCTRHPQARPNRSGPSGLTAGYRTGLFGAGCALAHRQTSRWV